MRNLLFVLASTATLAMMNPARAQGYLPPVNPGVAVAPGYVAPGYVAPGYVAPGYTAPSSTAPGYMWREQRANEDWRNNTWREQRLNEDVRNNNWRTQRANEDWRQREDYSKQTTPNNAIDRGYVGGAAAADRTKNNPVKDKDCGFDSAGSPRPCLDYETTTDRTKINPVDKDKDCGFNSVGTPRPCLNYAKDKTKIDQATDKTKINPIDTTGNPTDKAPVGGR
jgi:hypothetical protein